MFPEINCTSFSSQEKPFCHFCLFNLILLFQINTVFTVATGGRLPICWVSQTKYFSQMTSTKFRQKLPPSPCQQYSDNLPVFLSLKSPLVIYFVHIFVMWKSHFYVPSNTNFILTFVYLTTFFYYHKWRQQTLTRDETRDDFKERKKPR